MKNITQLRNFIFGIQDSIGSTCGFLSGIAVSGSEKRFILVSGVILIFVEAFSMGIGSLISDHSIQEHEQKKSLPLLKNSASSIVMFFSYFIAGLIILSPYFLLTGNSALIISIILSILVLIITSYISAKSLEINWRHHLMEVLLVGTLAIVVGVVVGRFLKV